MSREILAQLDQLPGRVVSHVQLKELGWSNRKIAHWIDNDVLHPVMAGVYSRDAHGDPFLTRAIGLCLRYPEGFLSGASAARYWGLRRGLGDHMEFTVPASCRPSGVEFALVRFARSIDEHDIYLAPDGLRVSSQVRTVFEAASRLDHFGLRSMIQDGINRKLLTADGLADACARLPGRGRPGTRMFRAVVGELADERPVQSEDELRMLDALRGVGLHVVTQHPVVLTSGFTVHLDLALPESLVAVEVDGPHHDDPIAAHRDKSRDRLVAMKGWQTIRVPTDDVRRRLRGVVAEIRAVAAQRARLLRAAAG